MLPVIALLRKYQSVPTSVADAELVRMAELFSDSPVLTLDSDFQIYRKNCVDMIPTIMPAFWWYLQAT